MAEIGDRVDLNPEVNPTWIGDAHKLYMIPDNAYDLVVLDPPYDDDQAIKLYRTPKLSYQKYVAEAMRVCKIGGYVAIYHWVWTPRPIGGKYFYRIVILTRVWHRPRVCTIFQKE
jgi:tRNA G10  N-methylase Trm11